ncbi:MAG: permease-like cell division protein FtsX [Wenzhouxiangellaceae bacterium]|nr:permease-like cell division protein FtsX [Wenzhouxiangellaceae bacterium]
MTPAGGTIRTNMRGDVRAWLRRHGYSLASSIGALVRHPMTSVLTIAVLAFALSLPLGLFTALENLRQINRNFERLDSISVFLALEADAAGSRRLASRISSRNDVLAVDPISPEDGMRELAGATGLDSLDLGDVPLPWVLEVAPASGADPAALADALRTLEGVDMVVVDLAWVERLEAILAVFQRLVELLAVLFALAVLFVISNNIRSEIQSRSEEIEVMALVGATAGFIRRPFLYSGLWMGALGGLAAWLLVHAGIALLQAPVRELAAAYGTPAGLDGPPGWLLAAMLAGSGLLGVAGAWIAVSRQLARINP